MVFRLRLPIAGSAEAAATEVLTQALSPQTQRLIDFEPSPKPHVKSQLALSRPRAYCTVAVPSFEKPS